MPDIRHLTVALSSKGNQGQGRGRVWIGISVVALLLGGLGFILPSSAAEFSCAAGDVACLINAINQANANGEANTITLEAGTYTLTAVDNTTNGPNGLPSVTSPLTIQGAGAAATILERDSSAPQFRLVHIAAAGTLRLKRLTLQGGGSLPGFSGDGGGLFNVGTLIMRHVIVARNRTSMFGGGLRNLGTAHITQALFTGNSSALAGGGVFTTGGPVTIMQTTFAHNFGDPGGGLSNGFGPLGGGTVTITDSTFRTTMVPPPVVAGFSTMSMAC